MNEEKCGTCRFWGPLYHNCDKGYCLAHPPTLLVINEVVEDYVPSTLAHEWCGEWEEAKKKPRQGKWVRIIGDGQVTTKWVEEKQ